MSATAYGDAVAYSPTPVSKRKRFNPLPTFRLVAEAIREGAAASSRYQQLVNRGVAPDRAAHQVFEEVYSSS